MRLIDRYIGRELLTTTLFAIVILSLVLVLGNIFKKLFDLLDHNVPATFIITFIAFFLPFSLTFSIPWGFLTAVLLVFGRLSAGNEMTAMRTAGMSIPRIARPVMVIAVVLCGVCLWINLYVAPRAQQNLRSAFFEVATNNPAAVFSGDRVITDFPGKKIYVGNIVGTRLENIHVFDLNNANQPLRVVYARTGELETDLANKQIKMRLGDSRYEQRDYSAPTDLTKIHDGIAMGEFVYPISLEELYAKKQKRPRIEALTYDELRVELANLEKTGKALEEGKDVGGETKAVDGEGKAAESEGKAANDGKAVRGEGKAGAGEKKAGEAKAEFTKKQASARTEFNKRFSFSLACFTFALIGIPLGITAHRQETSVGFAISLAVAFSYFLIILVVNIFREKASVHPELLIWLPNVIFLLLGGVLFVRLARR